MLFLNYDNVCFDMFNISSHQSGVETNDSLNILILLNHQNIF